MKTIEEGSILWQYLSPEQRNLAVDGAFLVEDRSHHPTEKLSDYSYIVFPFAKLFEGFLKQLLRDLAIIGDREYRSDHFRIGKTLSPHLAQLLKERSSYFQIEQRFGKDVADELWQAWKQGRNLVFHYFPHNYRALTFDEAVTLIYELIAAMQLAVTVTHVHPRPHQA